MRKPAEAFTAQQLKDMVFPPLFEPVPGFLCEGVHILAGRPKAGKSQLILQLAIAIAGGYQALGMFDTKQVGVLYLALEDGDRRLQRRIADIGQGWPEWLVFRTKIASKMERKLAAIEQAMEAFNEDEPAVIFIDTWGRFRPPKSGKDVYHEDYEPMAQLATLGQQRPQLTIVIAHHTKKIGADAKDMEILEQVSGSYGLTGAADGVMLLDRPSGSKDATLTTISRDTDERQWLLRMDDKVLRCMGAGRAGLKPEERAIIAAITALGGAAGPSAVAAHTGEKLETIKKRMQRMAGGEDAILTRNSRGLYSVTPS